MKAWPKVVLADIAPIVRRPVVIRNDEAYPELGIRSFGRGTFHKPALSGVEVGSKRLFRIEPGDLVFSNVFAWEGAIAVASPADAGRFGSHRFITCVVDGNRADANYLQLYLTASPEGRSQVLQASPGGAGRNRTLGVDKMVRIQVRLPPLKQQRDVVARVDALVEKTREVDAHLNAVERISSEVLLTLHIRLAAGRVVRLGEVLELSEISEAVTAAGNYPQVGVRGFGGGLFSKPPIGGTDTSYKAFNRLYAGAIVLSQVKGWEGAIARCPDELDGQFVSPEYRTFRCKAGLASDEYFGQLVGTEWFWSRLKEATRGAGARRERTRPEQFLNIELPLPVLADQLRIVEILKRQLLLKAKHAAIRQANAALIPATLERIFSTEAAPGI